MDTIDYSARIIICDDSITNVAILKELLESEGYTNVTTLTDPRQVLPNCQENGCELLLLDIEMPHMNGIEVVEQVRNEFKVDFIPILMLTGVSGNEVKHKALQAGANDYVNKPFDQIEVVLRVKNLIHVSMGFKAHQLANQKLEQEVKKRTRELNLATETLIKRLAMAGEFRDSETGNHVIRVGKYARVLAEAYGLPADIAFMIETAAPMHDIGKIGIPDSILLKKDKLSLEEMDMMKSHTRYGAELLGDHSSMVVQMASSIALNHHEHWDGLGYPKGLSGESIPPEGRIVALADVFDALSTVRPYKKSWAIDEVVNYIQEQSGKIFDPRLVHLFIENLDKMLEIREQYQDEP